MRDLVPGRDFDTDEHAHNIALTEAGIARIEAALGGRSLHALENVSLHAQLRHALHAEHLLRRDVDYIVRGGKVELVDESTGRVAEKRHWPDGLHAAVEAKEGVRAHLGGTDPGIGHAAALPASLPPSRRHDRDRPRRGRGARSVLRPATVADPDPPSDDPRRPSRPRLHPPGGEAARLSVDEIARVHAAVGPILVGTASVGESEELAAALVGARASPARC